MLSVRSVLHDVLEAFKNSWSLIPALRCVMAHRGSTAPTSPAITEDEFAPMSASSDKSAGTAASGVRDSKSFATPANPAGSFGSPPTARQALAPPSTRSLAATRLRASG